MTSDKHFMWHLAGAREWQDYMYLSYPGYGEGFVYGYGNGYMFGYTFTRSMGMR